MTTAHPTLPSLWALRDVRSGKILDWLNVPAPVVFFTRQQAVDWAAPMVDAKGRPTLEPIEYTPVQMPEARR